MRRRTLKTVLHTPLQSVRKAASIHQTVLLRERRGMVK